MKTFLAISAVWLPGLWSVTGCVSAGKHSSDLHSARDRRLTVGVVQGEIRVGMPQADVAASMGSPNIVTKDIGGTQTWIYDKISTEVSYSYDSGGIDAAAGAGGMPGGRSLVLGGASTGYNKSAGAAASTQRTLTVIIKFDGNGQVADFSYHSSRF
jgi:outer membrane protein assembly factor BamE (lipoprotein component of BamABCDE complex)